MKPDNSERNARIIEMREAGIGPREIARRLGVTPQVVAGVLHRAGLTDPFSGKARSREKAAPAVWALIVRHRYRTDKEAAQAWGVAAPDIAVWRRRGAA